MRILFMASGEFAIPTMESLHNSEHEIVAVVTQPSRKSGRGQKVTQTPVAEAATKFGYSVIETANVNDSVLVTQLVALGADVAVVIAFGQKIGPVLLDSLPGGFLNLHASLLPKYRGAAPYQWAVINGEEKAGVTVFRLISKMDGGPVLSTRWTFLKQEETAEELHDRLSRIGPDAVRAALEKYAGNGIPQGEKQDENQATRAPKLKKEDGFIDFTRSAKVLSSFICGMWSWPGATCEFRSTDGERNETITLVRARAAIGEKTVDIPAGQLDDRLYIATGEGWLELLEVKPSGGKRMAWPDFVNGRHVKAGDRFVSIAREKVEA